MAGDSPTNAMLVDDHELFRAGIRSLLERDEAIRVVAQAASAEDALRQLERTSHAVDLVILDIGLPGMNGLAAAAEIGRRHPHVRTLILSMYKDQEYVVRAIQAGCRGFVLKDADVAELHLAIKAARRGHLFLSPALAQKVAAPLLRASDDSVQLTDRQIDVLRGLAQGLSVKELAHDMGLSAKTVESHRAVLMERLHAKSVACLAVYAIRHGYIRADVDRAP